MAIGDLIIQNLVKQKNACEAQDWLLKIIKNLSLVYMFV